MDSDDQKDEDSLHKGDTNKPPSILKIFARREAYFAVAIPAFIYLSVYNVQLNYLRWFGIEDAFLSFELTKLVVWSGASLLILVGFWNIIALSSVDFLYRLVRLLVLFYLELFLGFILIYTFYTLGYSVFSLIAAVLFLLTLFFSFASYFSARREGHSFNEWANSALESERKSRSKLVNRRLDDAIPGAMLTIMFLIVAPILLGLIVGKYSARTKVDFLTFEKGEQTYIVITEWNQGFVSAGFITNEIDQETSSLLTGQVVWVPPEEISNLEFSTKRLGRIPKIEPVSDMKSIQRRTFEQLRSEVRAFFDGDP